MDTLLGIVSNIQTRRYEEDFLDRVNYQFTAYLFAFGSIIITSKLYMGTPIICWTPAEFRGGWVEYTRDYCLIENTYYVPLSDPNLPHIANRENQELPYYQWVQFVLVLLAFCFYLPHIYWRSVNWWSGIQLRAIIKACCELPKEDVTKREAAIEKIASHIYRTTQRRYKNFGGIYQYLMREGWLSKNYIFMKFMFIVNIVLQTVILHIFLGFNWGDLFLLKLGFNTDWKATGLFPRSTMCDFEVRNKGNLQRYSVQCVLSLNMFNEKIFLVLFYWLIFLFIVTVVNFMLWIKKLYSRADQLNFIYRMLESSGIQRRKQIFVKKFERFESSVNDDLIVILRLISSNAGANVCSDITKSLYEKY
ncbi:putative innexin-3 [Dictyocaulus viviparus]|uniref:Innexin n=1 Tax=Dictyocaulus viviparus TaxID=29172 RepID=A0A0D8Y4Z3_DICVI|nr:putative innexin-3 [Dictyocaulus viviparus]